MISKYSKLVGRKRTRVYYHLEPRGKEHLQKISTDYSKITEGVKKVLDSLGGAILNALQCVINRLHCPNYPSQMNTHYSHTIPLLLQIFFAAFLP